MLDIVTIGTATRDAFIRSQAFQALPSHNGNPEKLECVVLGSKITIEDIVFTTGGGGTNAAVTFARQGFKVGTIARVGNDVSGEEVRRNLHQEGVDISQIVVDRKEKTGYSIVLSHMSGERSILVYHGASSHWVLKDLGQKPIEAKWLYISSLSGQFEILEELIKLAKQKGMKIAYNPGLQELKSPIQLLPFLHSIDVLIMNREEGAIFTGISSKDENAIFKRIDEIEPGIFVLTDGPNGVWVSDGTRVYKAGTFREKQAIDRTGAGDAFGSAFVSGIMRRMSKGGAIKNLSSSDIVYAIRLASANATSKIEGVGAKYGLLTERDFEKNIRWQNLAVDVKHL